MRSDTRLSRLLHVLLHMAETDGPLTSDEIARMLGSNAVVVRRIMAGLRDAGHVSAERGHGGGWRLTQPTGEITLLDVYRSLGEPDLFAFGLSDPAPACLVEQSVNSTLEATVARASEAILHQFAEIRLSDLERDVERKRRGRSGKSRAAKRMRHG